MTLTPRHLRQALWCAGAVRESRATGKPVPGPLLAWNSEVVRALELEVALSSTRQPRQQTDCESAELRDAVAWVGAALAASILGWDLRKVQRRASDLSGRKVAGRWIFPETIVREYTAVVTDERRSA
ncbi:MAG: hypothetical protein JWR32_3654 [Mycobacterium sp.]|jgi:hypothetical protein|nr:hypothetical protein [Mycobacterium sp.]